MSRLNPKHIVVAATLVGFAVLPLVATVPRIVDGMRGASPASDFALLELSTSEAVRGSQLVGPYSRFGWRHPGPMYFYLVAPFYAASGGSSASMPVAAFFMNWAALLGVVVCLRRWAEEAATSYLALPLSLAYGAYLGSGFLNNVWNPAITMLPFGLFLFLCAGVACGRTAALPLVAAVGSFLVQTHVGYLPCAAIAVLTAVAMWLRSRRLHDSAARRSGPAIALTVGVVAALWALPLFEQLTRDPGNLTLVLRFFGRRVDGHTWTEAMAIVAREIAWPWSFTLFGTRQWYEPYASLDGWRQGVAAAFALVQTALLGFWSIRLRARPFSRALAGLCLASTLVAVLAVTRVSGEIRPYLTAWISMIGVVGTLAALSPLLGLLHFKRVIAGRASEVVLLAGLALAFASSGRPFIRDSQFPAARSLSDAVVAQLREQGAHRPYVEIQTGAPDLFYAASAVLLQLHKDGIAFSVDRPWWNFFGERWRPTGAEDGLLDFRAGRSSGIPAPLICAPNGASEVCVIAAPRRPLTREKR